MVNLNNGFDPLVDAKRITVDTFRKAPNKCIGKDKKPVVITKHKAEKMVVLDPDLFQALVKNLIKLGGDYNLLVREAVR